MIAWSEKSEEPEVQILDLNYLERLSGHLGADVASELLADGMLELADRLDRVAELADNADLEGLLRLTHDITGASGHLGLSALSRHAAEANRHLRTVSPRAAVRVVRPLLDVRSASIEALGKYCRNSSMPKDT
ncbi:MAG: Hpt domain-containing protein [Paracoccaceae bacterium]